MTTPHMKFWMDIRHTPVIAELVALAAKHTGKKIEYREDPDYYHNASRQGRLWSAEEGYVGDFTDELNRLQSLVTRPLEEPILEDDKRVIGEYVYIMDGKVKRCEHFNGEMNTGISVADYKRRYGVSEIRRCDMIGRQQRFNKEDRSRFEKNFNTKVGDGVTPRKSPWAHARRKPRSSNKIKKVG